MARVKNPNCLNFCTQIDPSKTRKVEYFVSLKYVFISRKTNFSLSPSRIDGSGHNRSKTVFNSFVKLLCRLSFEVCFCRDILPSFCLVRLCTSASNGIRLKTLLVSRIRILSFCPLFDLLPMPFN